MLTSPQRSWIVTFLGMLLVFFMFLYFAMNDSKNIGGILDRGGGPKIGLLRIEGMIMSAEDIVRQIKSFKEDPGIKAIIVRINSPGGAVVPSQDIYDELMKIKKEGEIALVTSMGSVAASGGYYIAAATDTIYASKGTLTGSIGVIMEMPTMEELMKKIGVGSTVIKSGDYKDMGSPLRTIGVKEKALLQGVMDDIYEQFVEAVSIGRGLSVDNVRGLAEGKVYSGRQALSVGLVDVLGTFEDAITATALRVGIKGKPRLVEEKKKISLLEFIETSFNLTNVLSIGTNRSAPFKYQLVMSGF